MHDRRLQAFSEAMLPSSQGLEAGEAEAKASIKAMQAEKAELEGRMSALEDKIEALETENANLESMKVGSFQAYLGLVLRLVPPFAAFSLLLHCRA